MNNAKQNIQELQLYLEKRFKIVEKVGVYKKAKSLPPLDEKRWNEVKEKIKTEARKNHIPEKFIENIWEEIHQKALEIEKNIQTINLQEEINLNAQREEITEVDKILIRIIADIYHEKGEQKTQQIINDTLKNIALIL